MATPRQHIEQIRRETFYIGREKNPLAPMLDKAVKYLSAELYTKDVHFLMELIQNAEDNEYPEEVSPSLEFVITSLDITATGAAATLVIFNNEKGFSPKNIESICNVGNSTKAGNRKRGYIGEKGIGFKSVFLITAQPYIFSNGYQICFNEKPCPHCNLGYVVPEWVEENPSLSVLKQIYGSGSTLPSTTIVLPLKPDKVKPVKQQLSSIRPEVLLFLSKIKRLSVREHNDDPRLNTVSSIAITKETNFLTRKNIDAESYTLYLSEEGNGDDSERECSYYMWKQKFPVRPENKVERRMDVEEWVITLAFPNGERLHSGAHPPGVYAFLPTEMVTNLPFIIQADFLLPSSRETILLDNVWNQGILDCVSSAFTSALISLVKMIDDAPVSSLPRMFKFLPINNSPYEKFNAVRESIRAKMAAENIIPSESHVEQKVFNKPSEVGRLMPAFWNILKKARMQGVNLNSLSSHGWCILHSSFDEPEYDQVLSFLGVGPVDTEWYAKCIRSSNLLMGVSEDTYLELLLFVANNWSSMFRSSNMGNVPLIKYESLGGTVSLCSINDSASWNSGKVLCRSNSSHYLSWLIYWNKEFRFAANHFFLPKSMQEAIQSFAKKHAGGYAVLEWLTDVVRVTELNVPEFAAVISKNLNADSKLVISFSHFLCRSFTNDYLLSKDVIGLCAAMPLVDNYGNVTTARFKVLVPANGSKWAKLISSNPWRKEGYIELSEEYLYPVTFAGLNTTGEQLLCFLKTHLVAADIPDLFPPNAEIPTVAAPLTKQNAFLLLEWIRNLKQMGISIPEKFLTSIKQGSWLKITMNGSSGYRPPSQSFLLTSKRGNSNWGSLLQNGSVLVDIPLVDQNFYGVEINDYKEELKTIGVMFEYGEACEFIGNHLMSLSASYTLTRSYVIQMLHFIKFLRQNFLPAENFIRSVKGKSWLRTSCGDRSPAGSVLFDKEWTTARQISDIPFIDHDYYGEEIFSFKMELQLLGVIVEFPGNHQLVADRLKSPAHLDYLTKDALLLALDCMRYSSSSAKIVEAFKYVKCLKTSVGYKYPGECFLFDPEWGCLLKVFHGFPLLDTNFYGSKIIVYKKELQQLGVKVEFEEAVKAFVPVFKQHASRSSITKENVFAFLSFYRQLKGTSHKFPSNLKTCIRESNWLHTYLGDYRSPKHCILFGPEWESIRPLTRLPFIDDTDSYYGKGIQEFKKELKSMGVVVERKDGVKFVASCLYFPQDPWRITSGNVLSLLECVRILLQENGYSFPEKFHKSISQRWLKTYAGYKTPEECCLFDPKWKYVKQTDGPFIDEEFYGSNISSYRKELDAIGVAVDAEKGCSLLASHLDSLSDRAIIVRIYEFLREYQWKPENEATRRIWIPYGCENGRWVSPEECVLHDRDGFFGLQLNVLDKHYEPNLLCFFSSEFKVKSNPSLDDYCKLWKNWENSGHSLSHDQCCAFWKFVMKNCSSKTEKTLAADLVKLPVVSGSGEILLFDKRDVFVGDDLLLKDLFEQRSPHPIFVWYPQLSFPSFSRAKLMELYMKIGVRKISESVQKEELPLTNGAEFKQLNPRDILIGQGLVRLILGFLADPSLNMEVKERHKAVSCLLNLNVLETLEPITIKYSFPLSSGEVVNETASRMIRWDRESGKFYTQKLDKAGGQKFLIEYATCFSEVIAEGVLWEREDHIRALSELIKLGFFLDFNEAALGYFMKSMKLQVFVEDEEFLSDAFPAE